MNLFKNEFVTRALINHDFNELGDNLSNGRVLKIKGYGNLNINGFEHGFLFIHKGSSIKLHKHVFDIEMYNYISGDYNFKGGICLLGESHKVDPLINSTIVETFKVNKNIVTMSDNNLLNIKLKEILLNRLLLLNNIIILLSNNISIEEISKKYNIPKEGVINIYNIYFIYDLPKILKKS